MSNDKQIAVVNHLFDQILELRAENKTLKAGGNNVMSHDKSITIGHILSELEVLLLKRDEQDCRTDELEADARLGRMVRNMPYKSMLIRTTYGFYNLEVDGVGDHGYYDHPETAFAAARIADRQFTDK